MQKIDQSKIYFFEVEDKDKYLITKKFPKAKIFAETFNAKTANKAKEAEILCVMVESRLTAVALKKCPNLKLIITRTVGYDHVDLKYAAEKKIPVCHVPDYGCHVIAEHVFALLLSSIRHVWEGEERTNKMKFSWKGLRGIALKGKTMGVVGAGKIGLAVCKIASLGFGMKVLAFDLHPDKKMAKKYKFEYVKSLDEIWKKSDVISLHLPLFPSTKHTINAKTIKKMKDGVILINTARGGLIDTKALVKAIKAGKFAKVALDVVEHEDNIKQDKTILTLPGVIITPHIAFCADDSVEKMYEETIASIERFAKHRKLIHQVKGH